MKLYEIIKTTFTLYNEKIYTEKKTVITSSMDKEMIDNMLEIYRSNQSTNEAYEIRTVRIPEPMKF